MLQARHDKLTKSTPERITPQEDPAEYQSSFAGFCCKRGWLTVDDEIWEVDDVLQLGYREDKDLAVHDVCGGCQVTLGPDDGQASVTSRRTWCRGKPHYHLLHVSHLRSGRQISTRPVLSPLLSQAPAPASLMQNTRTLDNPILRPGKCLLTIKCATQMPLLRPLCYEEDGLAPGTIGRNSI
ncbi:hypothetical protein BaRGS_00020284 [Batillaria attramentaria]|uniref:Uncharacterized protein n=1 Tax=Batillaria attramentaria TaxID=370345 RepID=A0ABD0KN70_9CAEN